MPCYNEEERLHPQTFLDSLEQDPHLHWIFVNDGSKDRTEVIIESMVNQYPERVFLKNLEKNSGKGEAVRQGLILATEKKATLTGYFDADLATPMSEFFRLLNIFRKRQQTVLLGSRVFLLGRHIDRKRWRFWLGRCFALVASQMLKLKVYDTQCGMKLIANFENFKACVDEPFHSTWLFDVELIQRLLGIGKLSISDFFEEPLLAWTDVGGSKVKTRAFFVALYDLFKIKLHSIKQG